MSKKIQIRWLDEPDDHDFPAAKSYLSLLYDSFLAKDILRASGLPPLGTGNSHVATDAARIRSGKRLSPVLLVRDAAFGRVVIADGYHRLCAAYAYDEEADIPCRIV